MYRIFGYAVAFSLFGGALAGAGTANATFPSLVGKTYSEATALLSKWSTKFEVTTSVGTELERKDCRIANQVLRPASHWGTQYIPAKLLLSLDCTAAVATTTDAGSSAGSPEGRAAKQEQFVEWWRQSTPDGQKWCTDNQKAHSNWDWSTIKGCSR